MKNEFLIGLLVSFLVASSSVCMAGLIGVSEIKVTSAYAGTTPWLQLSEIVATETGTGTDVALLTTSKVDSSDDYTGAGALSNALFTIDGIGPSSYFGPDSGTSGIFHSNSYDGLEYVSVYFSGVPRELDSITLYGRTDSGVSYRDIYAIELFDSNGTSLFTATGLDASGSNHSTTVSLSDITPTPEPATMLLFGTGLVGLVGSRIRKKKK